jgi:HEAT repeat protein
MSTFNIHQPITILMSRTHARLSRFHRPFVFLALGLLASLSNIAAADRTALNSALDKLGGIQYGQDPAALEPIAAALRESSTDNNLRRTLEERLIAVIETSSSDAARDYACRMLKVIGSERAVPALASLLDQPALSSLARYALESMSGTSVDRALREALDRTGGKLKAGVISSLAERRNADAVPALVRALSDSDQDVAHAAAHALGKIATPEAVKALQNLRGPEPLQLAMRQAQLDAADQLLQDGRNRQAEAIFEKILSDHPSGYLHLSAMQGLAAARGRNGIEILYRALAEVDNSPDAELAAKHASRLIAEWRNLEIPASMLRAIAGDTLASKAKVLFIEALKTRRDPAVRRALLPALSSNDAAVRLATIDALGSIGTREDVVTLAKLATSGSNVERRAARGSLIAVPGDDVSSRIVASLPDATSAEKAVLLTALASRGATNTAADVAKYISDPDDRVSHAAAETLGTLGGLAQVKTLTRQIATSNSDNERETLAEALMAICARVRQAAAADILAGLRDARPATRVTLIRVLSSVGGESALAAVRTAAREQDAAIRDAAIRSLAEWPDPAAAPDLLELVRDSNSGALRTIAFRGCVRMARESEAPPEAKYQLLADTLKLAATPEEKKMVLGAVGDVRSVQALNMAAECLADPALVDEAAAAIVKISPVLGDQHKAETTRALQEVVKTSKTKSIVDDAKRQLEGF